MKELKLGKVTSKELAEWFGIKPSSFANMKAKKLEELKKYADFEIKNHSIYIKEIYISEYAKMKHFDLVKDSLIELWCPNNLDTCKNVTKKLTKKYDKEELPLKESSLYNYTRASRDELFGKRKKHSFIR